MREQTGSAGHAQGQAGAGGQAQGAIGGRGGAAGSGPGEPDGTCRAPFTLTADSTYWRAEGTNEGAPSEQSGSCAGLGAEVVYAWTSDATGWVQATLTGDGDPALYVRQTCDDANSELVCNDDAEGLSSAAYFRAKPGRTYYLFADHYVAEEPSDFVIAVDAEPTAELDVPEGNWQAPGYGLAVAATAEEISLYEVTDVSCIRTIYGPPGVLDGLLREVEQPDSDELEVYPRNSFGPYSLKRVSELPDACADGGTPVVGQPAYEPDPRFVFDVFAETFAERYAFFELHGVDWTALVKEQRSGIDAETTDEALFEALSELIGPLQDGHVTLQAGDLSATSRQMDGIVMLAQEFEASGAPGDVGTYISEQIARILEVTDSYLSPPTGGDDSPLSWGMLRKDVAYLRVVDFALPETALLQLTAGLGELLTSIADIPNLVLDVRTNGGGNDTAALAVAAYFADDRRAVLKKSAWDGNRETDARTIYVDPASTVYPGRVLLMVGPNTASAAETFSMIMRELPRVTVVGHTTMGIFSDELRRSLPNGWAFTLSNEIYRTVDGTLVEGVGIPPDVVLKNDEFSLENRDAGIDAGLEELLAWMDENPPSAP
jgi:carboxyl-terminal processing protease